MIGIAEMFAELDGYGRYEAALFASFQIARVKAVERTRQWRKNNPSRARALWARLKKQWRADNPQRARELSREEKRRYRAKHPAKARAQWRRSSAAYRACKKAQAAA